MTIIIAPLHGSFNHLYVSSVSYNASGVFHLKENLYFKNQETWDERTLVNLWGWQPSNIRTQMFNYWEAMS